MTQRCDADLVTVVIVNYNRCDDLRTALLSVGRQDYPDREVIVVDNASQDKSVDMIKREFPDVRIVALDENIGMDGYSEGFKRSKGEIVFQMDNDSLMPDRSVLSNIVGSFKAGPDDLAVVATRVEEFNSASDHMESLRARDMRRGPINTGGFHSGGVGFRKAFLDRVGYYNRDVFLYGAELFLQMKFLAAGYRIFFYPEILMLHKSSQAARSPKGLYYEIRNRYWFMRKYATSAQYVRFLPPMLFHDVVYALYKKAPQAFLQALRDGFGPLPGSLASVPSAPPHEFEEKVNEVGRNFSLPHLWRRITGRMGGR